LQIIEGEEKATSSPSRCVGKEFDWNEVKGTGPMVG